MHTDTIEHYPPNQPLSGVTTEIPTPSQIVSSIASWELLPANKGKIVAVVPACNEERFIGSVVLKALAYADAVVVIDDGSHDATAKLADQAGALVISHPCNLGKAAALRTGFRYACAQGYECAQRYDVVVTLDGDGQHDAAEIPKLAQPILHGDADMVIGSRFLGVKSQIPAWRRAGQHALTSLTNAASGVKCTDSQTGFRAFRRAALERFDASCEGFAIESEMQFWARDQHLCVVEVPIGCVYAEPPKRNPVTHAIHVIDGIIMMLSEARPLFFFGFGGLAVALLGALWWLWLLQQLNQTNELPIGSAVVASLLVIWGMIASFEGVVLHMLRKMLQQLANRLDRRQADAPASASQQERR